MSDPSNYMNYQQPQMPTGDLTSHIMNLLGASQPQQPGLAQQILSGRFNQPDMGDVGQSAYLTAQSALNPNVYRPMSPEQVRGQSQQALLDPYTKMLEAQKMEIGNQYIAPLAQSQLTKEFLANNVANQTALPLAQQDLRQKLLANNITDQTGLPLAQAQLSSAQTAAQYAPQMAQSEIGLRGAQIPMMQAETVGKTITNQYLPESLQAEIAAKKAQAALAMGSNIFAGSSMGFGSGAPQALQPGGMTPIPGTTGQSQQQGQAPPANGGQFLSQLTPQAAAQVKALAEGRMAFPSGFALKTPYWQNMLSAVSQYDPNFDAINYNARAKTRASFTSGPDANNIAALNTAMSHLATLSNAYGTLGNGSIPMLNKAENFLGNNLGVKSIQTNTANVGADAEAVAHELAKVFRSTGMSEGEINAWKDKINTDTSPAQSTALINSALDLMDGRLQALGAKYNQGMGTTSDPIQLLGPEAQAAYTKLRGTAQQQQSTSGVTHTYDPSTGQLVPVK